MIKVDDPVLCFYAFFDKHLPMNVPFDPRIVFIDAFRECCSKLGLDAVGPAECDDADKIDLVEVARSPPKFKVLVNRYHHDEGGANQAIGYVFGDTLVMQVSVSKRGTHELGSSVSEFRATLVPAVAEVLRLERKYLWGCTLLFWGLTDRKYLSRLGGSKIAEDVVGRKDVALREAKIKVGRLWEVDTEWFDSLKVLLTPSSREMEKAANQQLFYRSSLAPADFPLEEMARHKFHWEFLEYTEATAELERIRKSIDRRLNWLIDTQRAYGDRISVPNSREAEEFLDKLSRAITNYSDYAQSISRVRELNNTLEVNRAIFEQRAMALMADGGVDSIFSPHLSHMTMIMKQLEIDCKYYDQVLERARTVLDSAQNRVSLLRGHEQTETVKLQGIQSSAVASVAVTAFVLQLILMISEFQSSPLLTVSFMSMVALGTFAFFQIVISWNRVQTALGRLAFSATIGFMSSTLIIWILGPNAVVPFLPWTALLFLACTVLGYGAFRYSEERANRNRIEELDRMVTEATGIRKLNYAIEELPDLLEDLPVTRLWRIKDEESLLGKLARKGPGYTIRDITDAIGLRYVVSPWELTKIVERIKQVVVVDNIEYRDDKITRELSAEGQKLLKPGYKSVHIDADLWGVGDKRDINLIAEIQVRTRLQDIYANFCHDRLYKPKSGRRPTGLKGFLVHLAVYLLQWITDIELLLFGGWMGWKKTRRKEKKEIDNRGVQK